jgi:hypothetical protein
VLIMIRQMQPTNSRDSSTPENSSAIPTLGASTTGGVAVTFLAQWGRICRHDHTSRGQDRELEGRIGTEILARRTGHGRDARA